MTLIPISNAARATHASTVVDQPTPELLPATEPTLAERDVFPLATSAAFDSDGTTIFLREIATLDLLSAQDEIALAQCVEAGLAAADRLHAEEPPSDTQAAELLRVVEAGQAARRRLILCNLRLVVWAARHYVNRGLSFMDLVQEGSIGLQIGTDKYDWRRGFRFSTYVYWWIRQAMTRSLADQGRAIRLPSHAMGLLTRVNRAENELQARTGEQPSLNAIAEHLGLDVARIVEAKRAALPLLSMDQPLSDEIDITRGDLVADEAASQAAQREVEAHELAHDLSVAMARLEPRERRVLELRFGINGIEQCTLSQTAERMHVSSERIRQIEQSALAKLRRMAVLRFQRLQSRAA